MNKRTLLLGFGAIVLIALWVLFSPNGLTPYRNIMGTQMRTSPPTGGALVEIQIPTLTAAQQEGKNLFDANCAVCHNQNATGTDGLAPPLVHKIYEPSHHGDASFYRANALGVRQHHWPYGGMPAIGLKDAEVAKIIRYIRALQRHNDIS